MSKKQWTVAAAAMLVLGFQFGCQGAGRFSRDQYAQMEVEVDPFLAAEPSRAKAGDVALPIMTASATGGHAEQPDFVNSRTDDSDAESSSRHPKDSRRKVADGSAVAAPTTLDFGSSLAQSLPEQTAAVTDVGFDEFLRQNEESVVQASAVFQEDVHEGSSTRRKVRQADHSVFPAAHQKVEIHDPVDQLSADEINPFAVSDALSSGGSEATDHDASWRPDNFKDVMVAE